MTITQNGARFPGPLGTVTGNWNGRIPGPLDFKQVDLSKGPATKSSTKILAMPPPTATSSSPIRAIAADWKLSYPKDTPSTEDVKQGELANCPVAAILAALAHTASGRARINSLITEYTGTSVKTTFTDAIIDTLWGKTRDDPDYKDHPDDYKPPVKEIMSQRYFHVALGGGVEVSDVFYIHYGTEANVGMVYMESPNSVLWPCVIEKAYAVIIGSYEDVDDDQKHKVDEFWPALVGSKLQGFGIDDKTDLSRIGDVVKAATRIPTIGASRDQDGIVTGVDGHHGFAVLGMQGSKVELYDPHGKKVTLSLEDFRKSFKAIYYGNP